jgi:protein phosphatase 2C family protein 2/3
MSTQGGKVIYQLSSDHKPCDPKERDRVLDSGGKVYVSAIKQLKGPSGSTLQRTDRLITKMDNMKSSTENALSVIESGGEAYGPHRVLPGRLSVSRALGDAHAKIKSLGGNPNVVIARPDIKKFKILENHDMIIMGSDGLYDKLTNSQITTSVFKKAVDIHSHKSKDLNMISLECAEDSVKAAIDNKSLDNIS